MDLSIRNVSLNNPVDIGSSKRHFDWKVFPRLSMDLVSMDL